MKIDSCRPLKVFYVRLSASKKREKGVDPKVEAEKEYHSQVNELTKAGLVADHIEREKKSGVKEMLALEKLVRTLPEGSTIYCVRIDRITRLGPFRLGYIIELAKSRKVKLITLKDGDLTDPKLSLDRITLASFEATAAAMEHSFLVQRIHAYIDSCKEHKIPWGIHKAKANGNFRPGHPPLNPKIESHIPRMLELREQGLTYREIAQVTERETGESITHTTVMRKLRKRMAVTA